MTFGGDDLELLVQRRARAVLAEISKRLPDFAENDAEIIAFVSKRAALEAPRLLHETGDPRRTLLRFIETPCEDEGRLTPPARQTGHVG